MKKATLPRAMLTAALLALAVGLTPPPLAASAKEAGTGMPETGDVGEVSADTNAAANANETDTATAQQSQAESLDGKRAKKRSHWLKQKKDDESSGPSDGSEGLAGQADSAGQDSGVAPGAESPDGISPFPAVTLEIPDTPLVRKYRAMYTTPEGLKYLQTVIKRPALYREYIRSETERQEVPECLFYLPVIESGFSQTAVSRSGATGVWQFMRNSVSGYGIRINDWMDERRDPWITTTAAIKKLKENYADLGDWYLALAAYNCGLGATRRAIKKAGTADYWYLSEHGFFKRETIHYVPKFLAIAEILSKSDEYGIDWGVETTDTGLTTIPVKRPVDISVLAKETGIDAAFLKAINPALFYSITPPDTLYALRIPEGQEDAVKTVLDDRSKMLLEYYMYKVKSGDTLYALALHYGISVEMILQYNPGVKASTLKIGKKIVIPAIKEVAAYQGKKDSGNLDFSGTYLVKQGDTLWSIALAYGIQVESLAEKNDLEVNSVLKLGKSLRVPIL